VIFAGVRGYLDKIKVTEVGPFEKGLLRELTGAGKKILDTIASDQKLSDETEKQLTDFIAGYAKNFAA